MNDLELTEVIYKAIVDGMLKGYLQYLDERKVKKKEMEISGAYAWTRGNHIDDQVSRNAKEAGINFQLQKAGYSWEYIQFDLNDKLDRFMFIIKNSKRIEQTFDGNNRKEKNYLTELSDINNSTFKNSGIKFQQISEQIELELNYPDEIKAIKEQSSLNVNHEYSRFYIVTYEINDETKFIDSINLMMPNSYTMSLVKIRDLTEYISSSQYEITSEDVESVLGEDLSSEMIFSGESDAYGISIAVGEERNKE